MAYQHNISHILEQAADPSKKQAVYFLFDSSLSVTPEQLKTEMAILQRLASSFPAALLGCGQFNSVFNEMHAFCPAPEFQQYLRPLVAGEVARLGPGGTILHPALQCLESAFVGVGNAEKILVILTDGEVEAAHRPTALAAAANLRTNGVTILGIGVGNADSAFMVQVCCEKGYFYASCWEDALKSFPPCCIMPGTHVNIQCSKFSPQYLNAPLKFILEITNRGSVPIAAGSILEIQPAGLYDGVKLPIPVEVKQYETLAVDVTIPLIKTEAEGPSVASISGIPESLSMKLYMPGEGKMEYYLILDKISMDMHYFKNSFLEFDPPFNPDPNGPFAFCDTCNIALFGFCGSGKTTQITQILKVLEPNVVAGTQNCGNWQQTLEYYPILLQAFMKDSSSKAPRWLIWDSIGINDNVYKGDEFVYMMEGVMPEDYHLEYNSKQLDRKVEDFRAKLKGKVSPFAIHCPIFVAAQGLLAVREDMERLQGFVKIATQQFKVNPILIISRIDEIAPGLNGDVASYDEVHKDMARALRDNFSSQLGILPENIFLVGNKYPDQTFSQTKTHAKILWKALKEAELAIRRQNGKQDHLSLRQKMLQKLEGSDSSSGSSSSSSSSSDTASTVTPGGSSTSADSQSSKNESEAKLKHNLPSYNWTLDEVLGWLGQIGKSQYSDMFRENNIVGRILLELSSEDLREMGINILGDRKVILSEIKNLFL